MTESVFSLMATAFTMGLMGSIHCLGMCGGMLLTISVPNQEERRHLLITSQLARVCSYTVLGLLFGLLGSSVTLVTDLPILNIVSIALTLMLALYILGLWNLLQFIERGGAVLWKALKPIQTRVLPIDKTANAVQFGLMWGLLPCGMVYTALALAISTGTSIGGALIMLAFGFGTLPSMLGSGMFAANLRLMSRKKWFKYLVAVFLITFAGYQIQSLNTAQDADMEVHSHHHH